MGSIFGRFWGPLSHLELTSNINCRGVINFNPIILLCLVVEYKLEGDSSVRFN